MPNDFTAVFATLKSLLARHARDLAVKTDTSAEYSLDTKSPSPFPQHKGHPLQFGSVRVGRNYVSYHLMPIYMSGTLMKLITPALKKHMQGKSCFNFKTNPDAALLSDLRTLTDSALRDWKEKNWL